MSTQELRQRLDYLSDEEWKYVQSKPMLEGYLRDALRAEGKRESERVERWHATYNATLTGLHAFSSELHQNGFGVEDSHEMSLQAANLAHGPLVKP